MAFHFQTGRIQKSALQINNHWSQLNDAGTKIGEGNRSPSPMKINHTNQNLRVAESVQREACAGNTSPTRI